MTLKNLEVRWSAYFSGDNYPPVLGLAALSDEESEIIHQLVAAELGQHSQPQWRTLFVLLHEFPACLAVWLARKAGEAYEAGAFWEKFGELIGVTIPINQRDDFAQRFRRACRRTMAIWLPPEELGAKILSLSFCTKQDCRSTVVTALPSTSARWNGALPSGCGRS